MAAAGSAALRVQRRRREAHGLWPLAAGSELLRSGGIE